MAVAAAAGLGGLDGLVARTARADPLPADTGLDTGLVVEVDADADADADLDTDTDAIPPPPSILRFPRFLRGRAVKSLGKVDGSGSELLDVLTYLKLADLHIGLLLNFNVVHLRRVMYGGPKTRSGCCCCCC